MLKYNKHSSLVKIGMIISLLLILFAIKILAGTPSATGYEISIYSAYPWYFWFVITLAILINVYILVNYAFEDSNNRLWIMAHITIILSNLIVILLPLFRNYYINNYTDEVNHLGAVNAIYITSHLGPTDYYPITHILGYQIASILNINYRLILNNVMPLIYYLIYLIGLYVLSNYLYKDERGKIILCMAFGNVLLFTYFNYCFYPTQFFLYLMPITLYILFKKEISFNFTIIFIIMILCMPFMHPLGSLFFVIILFIYEFIIIIRKYLQYDNKIMLFSKSGAGTNALIILFIIWFLWFSAFRFFNMVLTLAYEGLTTGTGESPINIISNSISMANINIINFISLLLKNDGQIFIFSILTLISIMICFMVYKKYRVISGIRIFYGILFVVFTLIFISTLIGKFSITGYSIRIYCWALVACIFLNSDVLYNTIMSLKGNLFAISKHVIIICIMIASVFGIYNTYNSPIIKSVNFQATKMDLYSSIWYFKYKNSSQTLCYDNFPPNSSTYIYGYDLKKPVTLGAFIFNKPHFGLDEKIFPNSYVIISKRIMLFKSVVFPYVGVITLYDINNLYNSNRIYNIYSNNETNIYEIVAVSNS
jgi:hypothetical protein